MNEIKIFENTEFGSIRTLEIDGEPTLVVQMSQIYWDIQIHKRR